MSLPYRIVSCVEHDAQLAAVAEVEIGRDISVHSPALVAVRVPVRRLHLDHLRLRTEQRAGSKPPRSRPITQCESRSALCALVILWGYRLTDAFL